MTVGSGVSAGWKFMPATFSLKVTGPFEVKPGLFLSGHPPKRCKPVQNRD
jgi:hypothetical protein